MYSTYISHLTNIIMVGGMLLLNTYTLLRYYYNITHGLDPYARSEIFYLLIFNFFALISTAFAIYKANPKIFNNKQNQSQTSSPTPSSTPSPTPILTPSPSPISTPSLTPSSTS